jgi:hypothetical protein
MPAGLARGGLDRRGAAQHGGRRVGAQPIRIVAGGHQQRSGRVRTDPKHRHQLGGGRPGQPVQHGKLGREGLVAAGGSSPPARHRPWGCCPAGPGQPGRRPRRPRVGLSASTPGGLVGAIDLDHYLAFGAQEASQPQRIRCLRSPRRRSHRGAVRRSRPGRSGCWWYPGAARRCPGRQRRGCRRGCRPQP